MRILIEKKKTLSELAYVFDKYPQKVFNVEITKKIPLEAVSYTHLNIEPFPVSASLFDILLLKNCMIITTNQ